MSDIRESVRDALKAGVVSLVESASDEAISLNEREAKALELVTSSVYWNSLSESERDVHSLKLAFNDMTALTCGEGAKLAEKAIAIIRDENKNLTECIQEGMASTAAQDGTQASDHGMYGVGDGGSKDEPKGDADKGTGQNAEHGDKAASGKEGYLDEEKDGPPDVDGDGPEKHPFKDKDGDGKPAFVDADEAEANDAVDADPSRTVVP